MSLVSVVIPIYKGNLLKTEVKSFEQCIKILGNYKIVLVCPTSLDTSCYDSVAKKFNKKIFFEKFNQSYFSDLKGYNQLMLSIEFYKRFKPCKFLLIYQLDAWVFKDELEYWCKKGYSFIGAPWFEGMDKANSESPFMGVGNGGFSLRRTNQILKLLRRKEYYQNLEKIFRIMKILPFFKRYSLINKTIRKMEIFNYCIGNEDYKIFVMSSYVKKFKLAPFEEALKFSFEVNPDVLYKLNNRNLPFGCHAWEKHNPKFWTQFVTLNS